jgi:hypothetical protein
LFDCLEQALRSGEFSEGEALDLIGYSIGCLTDCLIAILDCFELIVCLKVKILFFEMELGF